MMESYLKQESIEDASENLMTEKEKMLRDKVRKLEEENLLLQRENNNLQHRVRELEPFVRLFQTLTSEEQSRSVESTVTTTTTTTKTVTTTTSRIRPRDQQQTISVKQESSLETVLTNIAEQNYPRVFLAKKEWSRAIVEKYPKYCFFSVDYIEDNDVVYDYVLNLCDHAQTFSTLKAGLGVRKMKWSEIQSISRKLESTGWKEVIKEE